MRAMPGVSGEPASDRRIDIVLAEYAWASGLLPFYRQVEMTALGASGVVLSAVASVVAVIESGEGPDRVAEATLLSAAAWAPTVLLLIEIMALVRIRRAALYIREYLRPLARDLAGDTRLLRWEELSPEELFFARSEGSRWRRRIAGAMVSSLPVVLAIAFMTCALAAAGAAMHPDGADEPVLIIGYSATLVSACLAIPASIFTWRHEGHAT
jgi:hypothetical protein